MEQERPVTRESAETTVAELEVAMSSGARQTHINVGPGVTLERDDDGGFTMSVPGEAISSRIFPRTDVAPPGYDRELPFVENEVVMVSNPRPDITTMVWLAPRDPEATYSLVAQQSVSQGWSFKEDAQIPETPFRRRVYEHEDLIREVIIASGVVTLVSRPGRIGASCERP